MNEFSESGENESGNFFELPDLGHILDYDETMTNATFPELPYFGVAEEPAIENSAAQIESYHAAKIEAYNNSGLPEIVRALKDELAQCDPLEHPSYINKGTVSAVFLIRGPDGDDLAVRLPNPVAAPNAPPFKVSDYLERFAYGQSNEILEHPIAASEVDRAIVSPFIPGETINELPESHLKALSVEQFSSFVEGVCEASNDGVWFDSAEGKNFLYNPDSGIMAVDYSCHVGYTPETAELTAGQTLEDVVDRMLDSDGAFRHLSNKEQRALLERLHEGVDKSKLLIRKDAVHNAIDRHRPDSLPKRAVKFVLRPY